MSKEVQLCLAIIERRSDGVMPPSGVDVDVDADGWVMFVS